MTTAFVTLTHLIPFALQTKERFAITHSYAKRKIPHPKNWVKWKEDALPKATSCAEPYASKLRTPKTHSSCWGTPTADNGFRHTYAPHSVCGANEREVCNNAFLRQKKNPSPKKLGEGFLAWERGFEPPHREPGLHP